MENTQKDSLGGTVEAFFEEQGLHEEVYGQALKEVIAWQFERARKAQSITKAKLATAMQTSRTLVERVLDPANVAISIETLDRAAHALGKRLKVELVDA